MNFVKKDMSLSFNDFVFDKEGIIFASGSFNGLFQADFESGKADLIGTFPEEDMFGTHLYCGAHKYGKNILFIPAWGRRFALYNLESETFLNPLPEIDLSVDMQKYGKFAYYASISVGKYVYIFGYGKAEIIRFDMECLEGKRYEGWLETLIQFGINKDNPFFYKDICWIENSLFLVTGQNNSIVELNMKTDQIMIHPVGKKGCVYNTLAYDGKYFWLTERTKEILKVNKLNWKCQYKEIAKPIQTDYFLFSIFMNGEIWLFSNWNEKIFKVDCLDYSIKDLVIQFDESDEWYPSNEQYGYRFAKMIANDELAIFCSQDCKIHQFKDGKDFKKIKFYTKEENRVKEIYEWGISVHKRVKRFSNESNKLFSGIDDFIFFIKQDEMRIETEEKNYGKVIYECLREYTGK